MKHTPGPWFCSESLDTTHNGQFAIADNPNNRATFIANTIPHQPDGCSEEANALLIAAAPDLLKLSEAVTRVRVLCQKNYPHRSPEWAYGNRSDSEMQAAMNDLLDAETICAKAQGGVA